MPQTFSCVTKDTLPPTTYTNDTQAGTPVLTYDIGFPYISATDIIVFTGDTDKWTQRAQGTGADQYQISPQGGLATDEVKFNNGVGGAKILIWRKTDICKAARQFQVGSAIRAEDLNTDFTQLLYIIQELYTKLYGPSGNGNGGEFWNRISSTVKTPVQGQTVKQSEAWQSNDNFVATTGANDTQYETLVQEAQPATNVTGKTWFRDSDNILHIWNGSSWQAVAGAKGGDIIYANVFFVSPDGDDKNSGHSITKPMKTIKHAVDAANGDVAGQAKVDNALILVFSGTYAEKLPITIKASNLSIVGQAIRSTWIHPNVESVSGYDPKKASSEEVKTMFLCDNGTYISGFSIAGMKASGTRGNGAFADATHGLPENQGWVAAFRAGATIKKSPYIQNCTNFADSDIDNRIANFDPNNLKGEAVGGDTDSAMTGGGILVDGATVAAASPLRSFVVDSFTQITLDGPGVLCTNNGYAQLVSFFGTFCHFHAAAIRGGQLNLSNCTSDFGRFGLIADGKSNAAIFTGEVKGAWDKGKTGFEVDTFVKGTQWEPPRKMAPSDHMVVEVGGYIYPITSSSELSGVYTCNIFAPKSNAEKFKNGGLKTALADGDTAKFYLQSYISTGGHTMEFVGSGTNYNAHPDFGGLPDETKETVELGGVKGNPADNNLAEINGGRVQISSTNQTGVFKVGDTFKVNQKTGVITVPPGAVNAKVDITEDLDMKTFKIFTSTVNESLKLEANGTGAIILGDTKVDGNGNRTNADPILGPLKERNPKTNVDWDVVTQENLGYDPDEVPVNSLLGDLAYTNTAPSLALNTATPEKSEITFKVNSAFDTLTISVTNASGTTKTGTVSLS